MVELATMEVGGVPDGKAATTEENLRLFHRFNWTCI